MLQAPSGEAADYKAWAKAGASGFLVSPAAERSTQWRTMLAEVRAGKAKPLFVADTLGRPWEEVLILAQAGFDYLINSTAWWDLRENWFLRQQQELGGLVPTLSSPEPLHGMRLAHRLTHADTAHYEAIYRGRYLVAATASSGLICPMGYEFASNVSFEAATARETDWDLVQEQAPFDLSDEIRRINNLKATMPVLQGEGELRVASAPGTLPAVIVRRSEYAPGEAACLVVNSSAHEHAVPPLSELAIAAGTARFVEPGKKKLVAFDDLAPYESRLLATAPQPKSKPLSPKESNKRLEALAANRVVIEGVAPELDGGRFPVKRVSGDMFEVQADIFCDGHDVIAAAILHRAPDAEAWSETPMTFVDNDRWAGSFPLTKIGRWTYTILAWRDLFATWRQEVAKKHDAGQSITLELAEGCEFVKRAAKAAEAKVGDELKSLARELTKIKDEGRLLGLLESADIANLMRRAGLRTNLSRYERDLEVTVDRPIAACAAWYELMPRSQSGDPLRHGTFDDVIARLPYVRDLGFDVLYFPPIHPIGKTNRKGRNNSLTPRPDDPGSPYAIGAKDGGHDAIHRELGNFDDFARLIEAARAHGLEIAIDFAIQCSPDHPWIKEHPEWFDWRPDGSIKFAENPPKKYEDIVNVHFYRDAVPSLWLALRDVVRFWIEKGVTIFRVDNPHTKPVPFWEWMIGDIQKEHPEAIFLAEAFTRPKMMKRLAKAGFTQSYSYFTWRNTKGEITDYLMELTKTEAAEYMRPNFFVNTPDINPVFLQTSGPAGFKTRLVLAATLDPLYGVYNGFELCEATPMPGKEEYLNSEKYEIRAWDWDRPGNIKDDVRLVNAIRRNNPALWHFTNLTFLNAWNDNIIAFYKMSAERDNLVIVAVNLDPHSAQGADFEVPLWEFGLPDNASIEAVDLVEDKRFTWNGKVQHVWLDPTIQPYAIWRLVPPGAV
ncbi:MAG: alpha-1,4-glucan--maltose-1-phosphate maltosyltransferase [Methyloceanibacter sp.]|uniref:alpha-1,4-glucan--maltose-1-phosphate maltosyltransferase n=1 Tax=Methyloceanibacter sp. TaxID=1965321 RepID=UPI003EE32BB0